MSSLRVFVSNLPWTVSHAELRRYFGEFGRVVRASVVFDKSTGISRGYGFVTFADGASWEQVNNQKEHKIEGWKLNVQRSIAIQRNN